MAPPRRTASPRAVALRTLLLGAVASACTEPARPAASAPATTSTSTPSAGAPAASTPATQVSAPATQVSAIPPPASAQAPAATSSASPPPPGTSPTPLSGLPDGCRPARGLRRSTLKGERRDASGVPGCVDAVDGHCCGPAGGGMACARPFDRGTTLRLRAAGHAEVCCYALGGDEICEGRPLYVDGVLRRAALQSRADWSLAS